jgi:hypothetical protein
MRSLDLICQHGLLELKTALHILLRKHSYDKIKIKLKSFQYLIRLNKKPYVNIFINLINEVEQTQLFGIFQVRMRVRRRRRRKGRRRRRRRKGRRRRRRRRKLRRKFRVLLIVII